MVRKIHSVEGNLFTFGLICYFCPDGQKNNILTAQKMYDVEAVYTGVFEKNRYIYCGACHCQKYTTVEAA